jgi:uncharacterized membrane protein YdjX (TVP38/TMEM64 family)
MHSSHPEAEETVCEKPPSGPDSSPGGGAVAMGFFKRLGPAGPLALISAIMPFVVTALLVGSLPWVGGWLKAHEETGALLYFLVFAALGGLGFMSTHAYSALGGYAFGFKSGLVLALGSYTAAAVIAYVIARLASGDRVVGMIAEHPKSKAVYDALLSKGFGKTLLINFLIRLTSSPFAITNLVMAATRVNPVAYILATAVGMAPRTGALVFIASVWGLESRPPLWLTIGGTAVTLIVLGILGHLGNQAIARVTGANNPDQPA